jgi:hypothetical protein
VVGIRIIRTPCWHWLDADYDIRVPEFGKTINIDHYIQEE